MALIVNWGKSLIVGCGLTFDFVSLAANQLGCDIGSWSMQYLGVPNARSKAFWNPIIERCQKKLALWKANYLSLGGGITMIEAALSNLPIYFLSLFRIPKGVAEDIERMQRNFLWKGKEIQNPIW